MLFDISKFRIPLPDEIQEFASGVNRFPEIRGIAKLGTSIGVAVNHLHESARAELISMQRPVMIDSDAFSEVIMDMRGVHLILPIADHDWRRRLAIYLRLASSLREKAMSMAPDQVGNQQKTSAYVVLNIKGVMLSLKLCCVEGPRSSPIGLAAFCSQHN